MSDKWANMSIVNAGARFREALSEIFIKQINNENITFPLPSLSIIFDAEFLSHIFIGIIT